MTIEETFESVERKIIKYFCDICGERTKSNVCHGCNKILCDNHVHEWDYVYFGGGDYPVRFCKDCWNKWKKYRTIIKKLEDKISMIHEKWIKEANK